MFYTQLTEQAPTINALAALAAAYGHLPVPYITVQTTGPAVDLQLDCPADFEAWRSALGVAPAAVTLHAYAGQTWLATNTLFRGIKVVLSGHGLPITVEQARTSQVAPVSLVRAA
ncbi:hypothetical protein ACFWA6_18235 [Streptomyces sp. NPDC060020]|uniref:hypothetical protein n=1 Tax=Streptomyces sp. NPDC060020 TaxID=3347038 RepID=UPI003693F068